MFNDAPPAVAPDDPAPLRGDPLDLLDVELLEAPAVVGEGGHPPVRDLGAPLHRQLLEVRGVLRQALEPVVRDVTFA